MKIQYILLVAALCGSGCESEHDQAKQARLQAEARVSEADARQTALAQVPNGTIKESEIEREHGKLIWSFDVTAPDVTGIKEVNVDALTGAVVSVESESK